MTHDETTTADAAPTDRPTPRRARSRSKAWRKLHWKAYFRFPRLVPYPEKREVDSWRERDAKLNAQTRIPDGECITVPMLWAVEMYGPAEIESLYGALRRLGWSDSENGHGRDIVQWIEKLRSYGEGSGWRRIGIVCRPEQRHRFVGENKTAPLPVEVDFLNISIHQITPSLTALFIGFHLQGDLVGSYQRELQKDRVTAWRPNRRKRNVTIWTPDHQKIEAIDAARARLREVTNGWIKAQVPGFFSSLNQPSLIPTAELVLTSKARLHTDDLSDGGTSWNGWQRIISKRSLHDVWTSHACAGLEFSWLQSDDAEIGNHMVVSFCAPDFPEEEAKLHQSVSEQSYLFYCEENLAGILVHSASDLLLAELGRALKTARASLRSLGKVRHDSFKTIDQIGDYFDRTIGTPSVVSELAARSGGQHWYAHDCASFIAKGYKNQIRIYALELANRINARATRLVEDEESLRDHFGQFSSVLSVREGLRAQRRMERLTIAALIIALASLFTAMPAFFQWYSQRNTVQEAPPASPKELRNK